MNVQNRELFMTYIDSESAQARTQLKIAKV
jgi:hypothetical protein